VLLNTYTDRTLSHSLIGELVFRWNYLFNWVMKYKKNYKGLQRVLSAIEYRTSTDPFAFTPWYVSVWILQLIESRDEI